MVLVVDVRLLSRNLRATLLRGGEGRGGDFLSWYWFVIVFRVYWLFSGVSRVEGGAKYSDDAYDTDDTVGVWLGVLVTGSEWRGEGYTYFICGPNIFPVLSLKAFFSLSSKRSQKYGVCLWVQPNRGFIYTHYIRSTMTTLKASADDTLVDQIDNYCDAELDGMSRAEYIRRSCRIGMLVNKEFFDIVADNDDGGQITININAGAATSSNEAGEVATVRVDNTDTDYNELTLNHNRAIDPDEADFSDNDVLKESNKQRVIVLKGILEYKKENDGLASKFVSREDLASVIRTTFGVTSDDTVDSILNLASDFGVVKHGITNDPRLIDSVQELRDDVVRGLELTGSSKSADEIDKRVHTIRELSGRWSTSRAKIVGKWFRAKDVFFLSGEEWEDTSLAHLKALMKQAPDTVGAHRVVTRLVAIAVSDGVITADGAAELRNDLTTWDSWFSTDGFESVLTGDGWVATLEEAEREKHQAEREKEREQFVELIRELEEDDAFEEVREADSPFRLDSNYRTCLKKVQEARSLASRPAEQDRVDDVKFSLDAAWVCGVDSAIAGLEDIIQTCIEGLRNGESFNKIVSGYTTNVNSIKTMIRNLEEASVEYDVDPDVDPDDWRDRLADAQAASADDD